MDGSPCIRRNDFEEGSKMLHTRMRRAHGEGSHPKTPWAREKPFRLYSTPGIGPWWEAIPMAIVE
jgi:hypothetical protein